MDGKINNSRSPLAWQLNVVCHNEVAYMNNWAQGVEALLIAHLKAKKARKVEQVQEVVPHTWDDCQNGNHNWSCIGVGHGIETLECTCCGDVREFEV